MTDRPELDVDEVRELLAKKKRHKYNAVAVTIDGHRFPSKHEAKRYSELKLMHEQGLIADLLLQEPFRIEVNGVFIANWRADFVYKDLKTGARVVEDAKSVATRTRADVLRRKLVEALYGIKIIEV